ncbi:MAG TPA: Hsp20/alpha crystallin family protein [Flavisolibacter sp.]|jgi:HSP20 family protein|nr:Hsp20/alpha crystallin family protein [Flavisolibacter sp.]
MTLVRFQNKPVQKSFNNFIDDFFATVPSILSDNFVTPSFRSFTPVNIRETENDYVLELVAPGFQKEDFKINLDNNTLTISVEKKGETENQNEKFIRKEYKQQSFSRSFTIDENIDAENISAKYVNGVLTLNLVKKQEVKPQVKEISIQ